MTDSSFPGVRIGVLGAGRMAEVLVPLWVQAGYDVMVGGRTVERAEALANRAGARAGTLFESARFAEVAVLLVLYQGIDDTLTHVGSALAGKTLIDATNPVETSAFTLTTAPGVSIAQQIATTTDARVVKALNLAESTVFRERVRFGGARLQVPMAGDPDAQAIAAPIVAALDVDPFDAGPLEQALHLEAMAAVLIRLLFAGAPAHTVFQLMTGEAPRRSDGVARQ